MKHILLLVPLVFVECLNFFDFLLILSGFGIMSQCRIFVDACKWQPGPHPLQKFDTKALYLSQQIVAPNRRIFCHGLSSFAIWKIRRADKQTTKEEKSK